jgi:hypothetical protein
MDMKAEAQEYNLENSAGIDFVEDIAENEAIAKCKAELFLGDFFGQCCRCPVVHLTQPFCCFVPP